MKVNENDACLLYDITSAKSCVSSLSNFFEVSEGIILDYVRSTKSVDLNDFLDTLNIDLIEKSIDNINLVVNHITTNNDECNSIRDLGLINLQQVLSVDTPLKKYIKKFDIYFDISNNLMSVKDNFYEIKYSSSFYGIDTKSGKLNNVARKIYFDYQINGFFYIKDIKSYGGYVHIRPEFICDLGRLGNDPTKFEKGWVEVSKSYSIKFKAPIDYFTYYTFYNDINEYKNDFIDKLVIKRWLVEKALTICWEDYNNYPSSEEIVAYLKPEVSIPQKLIVEILELS